jgi:GalNAc-alpha-(1->4)-GalNAc-alpha-(1->3)-diNAcBac-PP-undecaprenol alpha-1,4-N-acetyl-D-galactosaminyltransferase
MSNWAAPMRLVLVAANLGPGGAEKVMTLLANAWARQGTCITLITLDGTTGSFFPLDRSVERLATETFVGGPGLLFRLVRDAVKLRRIVRRISPDAVVSFINSTNVLVLLALLGTRYPRVVSERSDPAIAPLGAFWRALRWMLYPTADRVVVQTSSAAAFFRGRVMRKVAVIPNPVIMPPGNMPADVDVPRPAIVSLGRFTEEKRFVDLIDAFATVAPRHPEWSLMIAGDGPLRADLERRIETLGLSGRARLPGLTKAPAAFLRRADIFVLSSRFEGFPNALCEAMALGRPVIATDCPSGPRHIVTHQSNGLLVPPMRPERLAEAIEALIGSPEKRAALGTAAALITETFAIGPILAEWTGVVLAVMAGRNLTPAHA